MQQIKTHNLEHKIFRKVKTFGRLEILNNQQIKQIIQTGNEKYFKPKYYSNIWLRYKIQEYFLENEKSNTTHPMTPSYWISNVEARYTSTLQRNGVFYKIAIFLLTFWLYLFPTSNFAFATLYDRRINAISDSIHYKKKIHPMALSHRMNNIHIDVKMVTSNKLGNWATTLGKVLLGATALYVMTAKDIQAQAQVQGFVTTNGAPSLVAQNALVNFTLVEDTTKQYTDLTRTNGLYSISDLITGIDDILDTQGRFIADGTVATDLQTGSGNRTIYANVGQPKGNGILYNILGQKIAEFPLQYQQNNLTLANVNLDAFADGAYFFVVQGQEGAGVEKLMNLKGLQAPPLDASPSEILNAKKEMQSTVMGKVTTGTAYEVSIVPTENSNINFRPLEEVVELQEGNNWKDFKVEELTFDNVDFYFTIRSVGDNYAPLANKEVRMYKAGTNTVLGTATTDANGNAVIENVKAGNQYNVEYEIIGGAGHHGAGRELVGLWSLPEDSVKSYQRMLMPETWQDPVTGETLNIDVDDITQWADGVDLMMATKGERRIHFDVTYSVAERNQWRNYNQQFQDRMGVHWNTIEVDNEIEFGIEEINAYLSGADTSNVFGVNYYKGGDETIPVNLSQTNGESLYFGAKVWLSMVQAGFDKEQGRTLGLRVISNRESFMNNSSSPEITPQDAVNFNALYTFHIGRFRNGYDNTNLLKMKDN